MGKNRNINDITFNYKIENANKIKMKLNRRSNFENEFEFRNKF